MIRLSQRNDQRLRWFVIGVMLAVFVFEVIRDCQRDGDFMGYVNAGNAVLNGTNIYSDYFNTWPPFFSIFSVPLAVVHNISPVAIRLIWLLCIGLAWVGIVKLSVQLSYGQRLKLGNSTSDEIGILDWKVLLPLLFVLRFIIDDLSNIQINSFLLLASLFSIWLYKQGKEIRAGAILGFIAALKVYPIFLVLFFLWKGRWKLFIASCATIAVTVGLSLLVFGCDAGMTYYQDWLTNKAMGDTILIHKNQSIFPLFEGLFTNQSRGLDIYYNILSLTPEVSKKLSYGILGLIALYPAYLLRYKRASTIPFGQFAFVLAAIPIVSPLAWKYYFVFLFPLYLVLYRMLFIKGMGARLYKGLFITSLVLSILSTDGLLGVRTSDVLEVFGCLTVATVLLLVTYLGISKRTKRSI